MLELSRREKLSQGRDLLAQSPQVTPIEPLSLFFTQRFYTSIPLLSPHSVFNRYLLSKKWIFQIVGSTALNTAQALSTDPQSIMGVHITCNQKLFIYQTLNTWLAPDIEKDDEGIRDNNDSVGNDNSNHLSRALWTLCKNSSYSFLSIFRLKRIRESKFQVQMFRSVYRINDWVTTHFAQRVFNCISPFL